MINMIYQCMNVEYIKKKNMGSVKRWLSMNPETTFKLDDLRLIKFVLWHENITGFNDNEAGWLGNVCAYF